MAAPTLHCYETAGSSGAATTVTCNKPTSLSSGPDAKNAGVGDYLIFIVGSDHLNLDTAQYDNSTNKPTGFTMSKTDGNSTIDAHCALFWKKVDGTETSSFTCTAANSTDQWAVILLVSGIHATVPVDVVGASSQDPSPSPYTQTAVTTGVDDTLVISLAAYDGGDDGGFTVGSSGSVWTKLTEARNGTGGPNAAGCVSYRTLDTAGSAATINYTPVVGDGMIGWQTSFAPAAATTKQGDSALDGSGDLIAAAIKTGVAASALSGTGDLAGVGIKTAAGASALSAAATLAGTATRTRSAAMSPAGTGDLAGSATRTVAGASAISGGGSLSVVGGFPGAPATTGGGRGSLRFAGAA